MRGITCDSRRQILYFIVGFPRVNLAWERTPFHVIKQKFSFSPSLFPRAEAIFFSAGFNIHRYILSTVKLQLTVTGQSSCLFFHVSFHMQYLKLCWQDFNEAWKIWIKMIKPLFSEKCNDHPTEAAVKTKGLLMACRRSAVSMLCLVRWRFFYKYAKDLFSDNCA